MHVVLTGAPAQEPVSPADVKTHLTSATKTDDTLLSCLITAARIVCEARTGLVCLPQKWTLIFETWPMEGASVRLPLAPVRRVTSVHARGENGRRKRVFGEPFCVVSNGDAQYLRGTIGGRRNLPDPCGPCIKPVLELEVLAGLADRPTEVPGPLRGAMAGLAAHWYTQRQPVAFGDQTVSMPNHIAEVLRSYSNGSRIH